MMKIPLGGKYGAGKFAVIDTEDYELVRPFRWFCTNEGYARTRSTTKGRFLFMHRLILSVPPGFLPDHVNGDRLDNRRANLRPCTPSENSWNSGLSRRNRTGFKGVSFHKKAGKWEAYIGVGGAAGRRTTKIYLGLYESPELAALAYNRAAREQHGEFARLNDL